MVAQNLLKKSCLSFVVIPNIREVSQACWFLVSNGILPFQGVKSYESLAAEK